MIGYKKDMVVKETQKNLYKLIGCYESTSKGDTNDI